MKTKSLEQVHGQLFEAWQRGEPLELQRIGDREFAVGEHAARPGDFVFDAGFADASLRGSGRHRKQTGRTPAKRLSRKAITLIVIGAFALVAWKGYRIVQVLNGELNVAAVPVSPQTKKLLAQTQKEADQAIESCLKILPMEPVPSAGIGKNITLNRDITIGGERQQLITVHCLDASKTYTMRFTKANGFWNVKSATPTRSRSLLTSN